VSLISLLSDFCSPVATGGFWGLSPPNKAPCPPKLRYEALKIGGVFVKFQNVKPLNKRKAPNIENFLATDLDLCNVDYAGHIAFLTTTYEYVQHKCMT